MHKTRERMYEEMGKMKEDGTGREGEENEEKIRNL